MIEVTVRLKEPPHTQLRAKHEGLSMYRMLYAKGDRAPSCYKAFYRGWKRVYYRANLSTDTGFEHYIRYKGREIPVEASHTDTRPPKTIQEIRDANRNHPRP